MKIEALNPDPFRLFEEWFAFAKSQKLREPEYVALATATKTGIPSVRIVLFRGLNNRGFLFHTNYNSRKAREMEENPHAALCFYWQALDRQVRVEGSVERASKKESDDYWNSRKRESQLSALASAQSEVIRSRQELEKNLSELEHKWSGKPIPRPQHWGGFCLVPKSFEFWQAHPDRLHHRVFYTQKNGSWLSEILAP